MTIKCDILHTDVMKIKGDKSGLSSLSKFLITDKPESGQQEHVMSRPPGGSLPSTVASISPRHQRVKTLNCVGLALSSLIG